MTPVSLTRAEARRIALCAQGFDLRRTRQASGWGRSARAIETMGLLQIDSVNVLVRSHYLPVYSRLGPYDRAALERRAFGTRRRALFEYWAHEASLLPLALHPLFRWRMARAKRLEGIYGGLARFVREKRAYVRAVLEEVRAKGPLTARELARPGKRSGPWWGWTDGKAALEYLFWTGEVTTATRRGFERVYDLGERVIPAETWNAPAPGEAEAIRALVALAARALGIATEADLRDYFRLPVSATRSALHELLEAGALVPAAVRGWRPKAYLSAGARCPGQVSGSALLTPFDPLIWARARTERLFDFEYRIEIYTPAAKRRYGYYVLPFLHRGRLVARVDLKAERAQGRLRVQAAHLEPRCEPGATAEALAGELVMLADWLGLDDIRLGRRGDLAPHLRPALKALV